MVTFHLLNIECLGFCCLCFLLWPHFSFLCSFFCTLEIFSLEICSDYFILCLPHIPQQEILFLTFTSVNILMGLGVWGYIIQMKHIAYIVREIRYQSSELKQGCCSHLKGIVLLFYVSKRIPFIQEQGIKCVTENKKFSWDNKLNCLVCRKSQRVPTQDWTIHCDWGYHLTSTWFLWQTGKRMCSF